jgi:flagella basal body P-ring formation protein FlgA
MVSAEMIEEAIRTEVARYVAAPTFLRIDVPEQIAAPNGTVGLKVSLAAANNLFQPFSVGVTIDVNGRTFRRFSAGVSIDAAAVVYVAARDLPAGTRISDQDLRLERRRLDDSLSRYLTEGDRLKGIVLLKPVVAGQEIKAGTFVSGVVVRSGDLVKIVARSGALELSISGQARSSGKVGERIAVKNLQSDAIIQATVVDEGVVEVRF